MGEATAAAGAETARPDRERFFAAYRSARRRAAESGVPLGEEPASAGQVELRRAPIPYPGLRSFNPREGNIFFGRERNVRDVRDRLADNRVVVVLGGSGSGKSSVIRAGLMPRLTSTMAVSQRSGNWYAAEFRPRLNPVGELAAALTELVRREFPEQQPDRVDPIELPGAAAEGDVHAAVLARIRGSLQLRPENEAPLEVSTEPQDRIARTGALCDGLLDFVDYELDRRDEAATRGYRSGRPSLLLLIDQFEEVFRPEVPIAAAGGRQDLLDMIIAVRARLEGRLKAGAEGQSGLFIAITMRSEELHRCAEHPSLGNAGEGAAAPLSLADLVNQSGYLLDLLDPEQDRRELRDAIIEPARLVFRDWGLPFDAEAGDAPFEPGVVDRLLKGAAQLSQTLEHRADQLPLLQHALQTMWHRAVQEWEVSGTASLLISYKHLDPRPVNRDTAPADLVACLDSGADEARRRAIGRYLDAVRDAPEPAPRQAVSIFEWLSIRRARPDPREADATGDKKQKPGEAVLRAAFRSLARRDDRGNWVRRFADLPRILQFIEADREMAGVAAELRERGARAALGEFIAAGYLTGGKERPYDVSHEALLRNWRHCQFWLFELEETAQALVQLVNFLPRYEPADFISFEQAVSVALAVGPQASVPEDWAKDQIMATLNRPDVREQWRARLRVADEQPPLDEVLNYIYLACEHVVRKRLEDEANKYRHTRFEQTYRTTITFAIVLAVALFLTWGGIYAKWAGLTFFGLKL
jgi:hypothetical protein